MFNIFKKDKNITSDDFEFLRCIVSNLPEKYKELVYQVNPEFILDKKINEFGPIGTFRFVLNAKMESKFVNKSLPKFFIIKNIRIWNNIKQDYVETEIHLLEGMIAGYFLNCPIKELDFQNIDTKYVMEKHFLNQNETFVENFFKSYPKEIKDKLNIKSSFIIEIEEGTYYVIKDFKDGNYLAINKEGSVFFLKHDEYEIKKIFTWKKNVI